MDNNDNEEMIVSPHLPKQNVGAAYNKQAIAGELSRRWAQGPDAIYQRIAEGKTPEQIEKGRQDYIDYLIMFRHNDPEGVDQELRRLGIDPSTIGTNTQQSGPSHEDEGLLR